MEKLEELRNRIDKIDKEIVKNYLERIAVCEEIADEKKKQDKIVLDSAREQKVLFNVTEGVNEEYLNYVKNLYNVIFSCSKSQQMKKLTKESATCEKIENKIKEGLSNMPLRATCACQGIDGANSKTATEKVFPISDITFFKNFEGVFNAVDKGLCEFGVLPIENSTAGSVLEVYDLMTKYNFHIVKAVRLKIEHCLAGVKGTTKESVKKVLSHPQAIRQCAEYLKNNKYDYEYSENTAVGAKTVMELKDKSVGVLCSPDCAKIYGLDILERSVNDNQNNYTRFIVIKKDLEIYKGSNKISVMTSLSHQPGSLNNLLMKFSSLGLNLTKIESRPILKTDFEFMFYFDFLGDIENKNVISLISELENSSDKFVFLGSYSEIL